MFDVIKLKSPLDGNMVFKVQNSVTLEVYPQEYVREKYAQKQAKRLQDQYLRKTKKGR